MSDWIKMRSSLLTNPKVIRMARELLQNPEFVEWMCPGMCPVPRDGVTARDESVTKRHIPVVTRIVVGSLVQTWSAVNDTAARDGVIRHATSRDIDESAGVPGFGKALTAVGWLEDLPDGNGVRFVNFEEHNQPQKERALTAKTGAERQKEYRERKQREAEERAERDAKSDAERNAPRDVTVTSQGDGREEKKRGEKKNPSGSTPPSKSAGKPKASKRVPADFEVSPELQAWADEKAPLIDWRRETEKFRDWEFQHPRTDWDATWRTWMRKAQETAASGAGGHVSARQEKFV